MKQKVELILTSGVTRTHRHPLCHCLVCCCCLMSWFQSGAPHFLDGGLGCLEECPSAGSLPGYNTYVRLQPAASAGMWRPDTQLLFMMRRAQVDRPRPQANPTPNPQIHSPHQRRFYFFFWGGCGGDEPVGSVPASLNQSPDSFQVIPKQFL